MKIITSWIPPSVWTVVLTFFLILSCKQPSNFEGGNNTDMVSKEIQLQEPPPLDNVNPPPPPPPTQSDALKMTENLKQYKSDKDEETQEPQKAEIIERKVIKTGNIRFKTKDIDKTRQAITNAVNALKGYVSEESQTSDGTNSEMHLTVRVPAQYFDSLMTIINSNAEYFDSKNIHTQDVTEEFIDVTTRIRTKKSLESQFLSVLKQAKSIKEIMEVQRELNTVREEIESAEGRLRYLSSQVSYSTLTLVFYKEMLGRSGSPRSFWSRLGDGFVSGWQTFLDIIIGLVAILPVLLMFGGVFWIFRRIWIKSKEQKAPPQ
jgi:Domain of unknown function (DUF4349)